MISAEGIFNQSPTDGMQVMDDSTPASVQTRGVVGNWGLLPVLSLTTAWGLLFIAFANTSALNLIAWAQIWFWLGLLLVLVPTAMRLVAIEPSRHERLGLLLLLGLALYLVKVLHSPFGFTYSDEFLHYFNVNQILQQGTLFTPNPILPVSALFPGLSSITAAFATLSGLSVFYAGLFVIGLMRVILVLALFLFIEQIGRSARLASVTTLIYMCHSNFLFWSAQFSYESLALPLAISVFYLIARRERATSSLQYLGFTCLALLGIGTVVITHHLTSYFLALFLIVWWLIARFQVHLMLAKLLDSLFGVANAQESEQNEALSAVTPWSGPGALALIALVATVGWLIYVALLTFDYLSLVLNRAALSIIDLLANDTNGRQLFVSASGQVAPLWEQGSAIAAVVLSLAGLAFGLIKLWRYCRNHPVILLLTIAAALYFVMLGMRFTSAGWETGNRASAYLFLGLAFVIALAVVEYWMQHQATFSNRLIFSIGIFVLFSGGVIAGWQPFLRLSQPYLTTNGKQLFEPQGVTVAKWAKTTFGPGHRLVADEANGRLMLAIGEQYTYAGRHPFVSEMLKLPKLDEWQRKAMKEWGVQHLVVDQRKLGWHNMAGYFFDPMGESPERFDEEVATKFDRQEKVDRVLDSGNIVIYDIGALANEPANQ